MFSVSRNGYASSASPFSGGADAVYLFIHKLRSNSGFGEDILDHATFLELMVFLNHAFDKRCRASAEEESKAPGYHAQVDEILSYINTHISENLTLEELSAHFS